MGSIPECVELSFCFVSSVFIIISIVVYIIERLNHPSNLIIRRWNIMSIISLTAIFYEEVFAVLKRMLGRNVLLVWQYVWNSL